MVLAFWGVLTAQVAHRTTYGRWLRLREVSPIRPAESDVPAEPSE